MNVLYDANGYEYPIDDYGQIYVLLKTEQTAAEVIEEEKMKETKNLKGSMLAWPLLVRWFALLL